jgi:hypothetical protein
MQRNSKGLALMFLLGALLVGGVVGFTTDRLLMRDRLCPRIGDQRAMRERIADELELDAGQRVRFDSILTARNAVIDSIVQPLKPQTDSVIQAARVQIRAMLTPAQQVRYDALRAEQERNKAASSAARTEKR